MIRAVIFDMDGLITDSERVALTAIHQAGENQGYDFPMPMIESFIGVTSAYASGILRQAFPGIDAQKVFADFRTLMHQLAQEGRIPLKKGVKELLAALKERNIPHRKSVPLSFRR